MALVALAADVVGKSLPSIGSCTGLELSLFSLIYLDVTLLDSW